MTAMPSDASGGVPGSQARGRYRCVRFGDGGDGVDRDGDGDGPGDGPHNQFEVRGALPSAIHLNVKFGVGRMFSMRARMTTTIPCVKNQIAERLGIGGKEFRLVFNMNDSATELGMLCDVASWHPGRGAEAKLEVRVVLAFISIFVQFCSGEMIKLDNVPAASFTIENLKWLIEHHHGFPSTRQRLVFQGRTPRDDAKLFQVHIQSDSVVTCRYLDRIHIFLTSVPSSGLADFPARLTACSVCLAMDTPRDIIQNCLIPQAAAISEDVEHELRMFLDEAVFMYQFNHLDRSKTLGEQDVEPGGKILLCQPGDAGRVTHVGPIDLDSAPRSRSRSPPWRLGESVGGGVGGHGRTGGCD